MWSKSLINIKTCDFIRNGWKLNENDLLIFQSNFNYYREKI